MGTLTRLSVIASAALLGACATPYKPDSALNQGGYSESKRAPGVYQVWFEGNEFSDLDRTEDLAMLRGAELCLAEGMPFMRASDFRFDVKSHRYAQMVFVTRVPRYGDVTPRGGQPVGSPYVQTYTTEVTPGKGRLLTAGLSGILVTCLPEKSDDAQEAAVVAASIRERYEIAAN